MTTTRRQLLTATGVALGVGTAGAVIGPWASPAAAQAPHAAPTATPAAPRSVYGTPTDLAHDNTEQAWTREADGTVWTYDRKAGIWQRWRDQQWKTVLTYGTVVVAHWGKPSGPFQSVMVFGVAPSGGGTPPPPPGGGGTPTPPPHGGQPSPGHAGNSGYSRLANTGFDAEKYGLVGAAVIAAGAVLTRWAAAPRPSHAGAPHPSHPAAPQHRPYTHDANETPTAKTPPSAPTASAAQSKDGLTDSVDTSSGSLRSSPTECVTPRVPHTDRADR